MTQKAPVVACIICHTLTHCSLAQGPKLVYWQLRVQSGRHTVTPMPTTREWRWPGLQHSRIKWARFGLLLPCSITSVWLGHIPSHYTGRPHPQGWWRNASLSGVKVATGVQLGGLFATDRSCSYGVRQLWVAGWPLLLAIAWCLLNEFGLRWIERNSFSTTASISAQPRWLY